MKRSELRKIISEEISKINEAQYADRTGILLPLINDPGIKSILDKKTLKFLKSSDVRLFEKIFTDYGIFTDGKREVVISYKEPEIIKPLSRASKLAKELYNRDIEQLHIT